jgi:hypothetical protein
MFAMIEIEARSIYSFKAPSRDNERLRVTWTSIPASFLASCQA